ncbi:uncharacterized protein M437DRAFT_60949, partial [Aureobasidium melanogenum CBS 110374]
RWKEAEKLKSSVLRTGKKVVGEEHPRASTSTANFAATFKSQRRIMMASWRIAQKLLLTGLCNRKERL